MLLQLAGKKYWVGSQSVTMLVRVSVALNLWLTLCVLSDVLTWTPSTEKASGPTLLQGDTLHMCRFAMSSVFNGVSSVFDLEMLASLPWKDLWTPSSQDLNRMQKHCGASFCMGRCQCPTRSDTVLPGFMDKSTDAISKKDLYAQRILIINGSVNENFTSSGDSQFLKDM